MMWPVDYATKSQDFGSSPTRENPDPVFGDYQPDGHTGIDFAVAVGTQIKACDAGTVVYVGWYSGDYLGNDMWLSPSFAGWCYVVDHAWGRSIYGHGQNGGNWVSPGQNVAEGQVLGLSGNTGASTGPHLHFETLPDGWDVHARWFGRVDPHNFISNTTTQQEDEMSAADVEAIVASVNHAFHRIKTELPGDTARAVLTEQVPYKNPTTGEPTGQSTSLATLAGFADFQAVQTRMNTDAKSVAASIPDGIAQDVVDALMARLKGGK